MIWVVLDINFEVLVICSGGDIQEAVGNAGEDNWIEDQGQRCTFVINVYVDYGLSQGSVE